MNILLYKACFITEYLNGSSESDSCSVAITEKRSSSTASKKAFSQTSTVKDMVDNTSFMKRAHGRSS